MHYAFIDEFGGVSDSPEDPVLVVATVVTVAPRNLDLIVKSEHRNLGASRVMGELKASRSDQKVIRRVLQAVVAQDVAIVAVVMDKRGMQKPARQPEDIYRRAVGQVIRLCVARWPRLDVILDKRYTQEHLRHKLERSIRDEIADMAEQAVTIRQEDSQARL